MLSDAQQFAAGDYAQGLGKGDTLTAQERQTLIDQVARFTGIDRSVVDRNDMRLTQGVFCHELLLNQRLMVGRLDSRFTGDELSQVRGEGKFWDPSMAVIRPPFTATFNNYVRTDLGYKSDLEYYVLGGGVTDWDWGSAGEGFPDTSEALRLAFVKNPYMKLFVANGYYDLATPFFATQYTLNHMNLTAAAAQQDHARLLRCGTHDVHQERLAVAVEEGRGRVPDERAAVSSISSDEQFLSHCAVTGALSYLIIQAVRKTS